MNLITCKPTLYLLTSLVLGTAASAAYGDECDGVIIHSRATAQALGLRAAEVRHCLDLAHEGEKAAYRSSMLYCRNIASANGAPATITLPSQVIIEKPAGAETWEQYALALGEGAASAGCRDGILASLQQTLFLDRERVRNLFVVNEMLIENQFVGTFALLSQEGGVFSTLHITSSTTHGRFANTDRMNIPSNGVVAFNDTPLTLAVHAQGWVDTPFGSFDFELPIEITGSVKGALDSRTLTTRLDSYQVASVRYLGNEAYGSAIQSTLLINMRNHATQYSSLIANEMTFQLRRAYEAQDPFQFLSTTH